MTFSPIDNPRYDYRNNQLSRKILGFKAMNDVSRKRLMAYLKSLEPVNDDEALAS